MIFNYNTLNVALNPLNRSMTIELNRPDAKNAINKEMIFELENLFNWLNDHLEVNSVLLSSTSDYFCSGFDKNELKNLDTDKFKSYLVRIQKLITTMNHIPQTIVCDLKNGASGIGAELSLGADIRIANTNTLVCFDSLKEGLVPTCGGVGILSQIVGPGRARAWTLSGIKINSTKLLDSGFIIDTHEDEDYELAKELLDSISTQSPVARIQAKRSFLEQVLPEIERAGQYEANYSFANMVTNDWKNFVEAELEGIKADFTNPRDLATKLTEVVREL